MSAMPEGPATPIAGNAALAGRDDWRAVEIEEFLQSLSPDEPVLPIGAGPYRLKLHEVPCPACSSVHLLRHYLAKTLALGGAGADDGLEGRAAQLAGMDSISLAQEFIASRTWITAGGRGRFVGLGAMYIKPPRSMADCNAALAVRLEALRAAGQEVPPVAGFVAELDGAGRKCLRPVCRQCGELMQTDGFETGRSAPRFSFTLTLDGETALFNLPLLVRGLTAVDLSGMAA